jgi:uncharacterized lipoprotein YajG
MKTIALIAALAFLAGCAHPASQLDNLTIVGEGINMTAAPSATHMAIDAAGRVTLSADARP